MDHKQMYLGEQPGAGLRALCMHVWGCFGSVVQIVSLARPSPHPSPPCPSPHPMPPPSTAAGAFDAPEQAAHAHDIGALCSGKARPESLNFPLSDYEPLLPLLASLPHVSGLGWAG